MNLIPFNPFPGSKYRRSATAVIQRFRDELLQRGVLATIRRTRGEDIDAACGQLAGRVALAEPADEPAERHPEVTAGPQQIGLGQLVVGHRSST